ncbi:uncharacterized protein LOC126890684 [Diabrotica virgifera virgifera]|uniref:Isoleucine--tRNA ligase cytoplasmic ubiquitin-like domain-containing protein n=1 Tax=Diabrotica virgifera virgifera TaxID=50390 RepID=A0ABM5L007_DIAVI|nr:uncharacterized protein LOC126890684 [Diabrotica virgifera virgifera]
MLISSHTLPLSRVATEYTEFIENTLKTPFKCLQSKKASDETIIEEKQKLKDFDIQILLTKNSNIQLPVVKWVNLQLVGLKSKYCKDATKGLVLLEAGSKSLSSENLKEEASRLFNVDKFSLVLKDGSPVNGQNIDKLSSQVVFVVPVEQKPELPSGSSAPFCKFLNFEEKAVKGTIILENPVGNPTKYVYQDVLKLWAKKA